MGLLEDINPINLLKYLKNVKTLKKLYIIGDYFSLEKDSVKAVAELIENNILTDLSFISKNGT